MSSLNKFQQNIYLVIFCFTDKLLIEFAHFDFMISHRGESRTPKATKIGIFVEIFSLTIVTKNFVLDVTVVLDSRDRL